MKTILSNNRAFVIAGRPERLSDTLLHLRDQGIEPDQFPGFNGLEAGLLTTWTYDLDHPGTFWRIGLKETGVYLAHQTLWRVCQWLDADSYLIFEDDVRFVDGWQARWDESICSLPSDWDMLFLGPCCCAGHPGQEQISGSLWRVRTAQCLHAYAIRQSSIPTLLKATSRFYAPIDIAVALHAMPHLNVYAFLPRLAIQSESVIPE